MTTVAVVRKGGQVAIAADTLVTFGDTRLAHGYEANEKLFRVGDSWIGMSGTTAHFPVLRRALNGLTPDELKLHSRDEVFEQTSPLLREVLSLLFELPRRHGRYERIRVDLSVGMRIGDAHLWFYRFQRTGHHPTSCAIPKHGYGVSELRAVSTPQCFRECCVRIKDAPAEQRHS